MTQHNLSSTFIALHRFGLGSSADDAVAPDARRYLYDQLALYEAVPAVMRGLPDGGTILASFLNDRREARRSLSGKLTFSSHPAEQGSAMEFQLASKPGKAFGSSPHKDVRHDYFQDIRTLYRRFAQARMADSPPS